MIKAVDNSALSVDNSDPKLIWDQCLSIIKKNVNPQSFQTWFTPIIPVKIVNNTLTIKVPNQFFYEWIEEHYPDTIRSALKTVLGENSDPVYHISSDQAQPDEPYVKHPSVNLSHENSFRSDESSLNRRYTFKTFVEGSGNQFAKAAALAVAEAPGKTSFNPLVIYGGVGLGKTHLIQAIGNFALENKTVKRIRYLSSEKFTIDFINSIQNNLTTEFSRTYRNVDMLLVDDIQFFMSKERTQEEFFHTFNTLHQKGKQIVLSSDRPPRELKGLEERLISRFQWGLVADIQPPDLETRIAILQQKAQMDEIDLSNDIIDYIATNITSNIRELEGALIKLLAVSSLKGVDLRGKSRKKEIAFARQIAMYLSKEMTQYSLKSIGLHFGGRDHTTIIHGVRTIDELIKIKKDKKVIDIIEILKNKIEVSSL